MDITFVTSARTDQEAKSLLTELGIPFKRIKNGERIYESTRSETCKNGS